MKCVVPAKTVVLPNGCGLDDTSIRTRFMIEQCDVGRTSHDYLGHKRPAWTFRQEDVGRIIETIRDPKDPAYFSWSFVS